MDASKQVYIGNLAWTTNSEQLLEFLMRAGNVTSAQVQRHEDTKRSKGWGLAEFTSPATAQAAIAMLDKATLHGRQLHLRLDRRQQAEDPALGDKLGCNVFVGNLQWAVTQDELLALFAAHRPLDCSILTNMYGRSKGFAILRFASEPAAAAAIAALHAVDLRGRSLECRLDRGAGRPEGDGDGERAGSVFVSKLGPAVTDDASLAALFLHIGPVASARLQRASNGKPKGWGIVTFADPAHARRALALHGQRMPGASADLEVRLDRKGSA